MKVTTNTKKELIRYAVAYDALKRGDKRLAIIALQMGELPIDKLELGVRSRLDHAYRFAVARKLRISAKVLAAATNALSIGVTLPKPLFIELREEIYGPDWGDSY